jgi:predicted permease
MLSRLRSLLAGLFKRSSVEHNMSDEIRFHLQVRTEDLIRSGLSEEDAQRRARLEFGNIEAYKEMCRQSRGLRLLDEVRGDLRYAFRILARRPAFAIVALITLACGIGINTAVFSIDFYAQFFQPIPVQDPWSLYEVAGRGEMGLMDLFSYREYLDLADRNEVFKQVVADSPIRPNTPAGPLHGYVVSGNYFSALGVPAVLGRPLLPDDDQPASIPVVVLSHDAWQTRFGADPSIVGQRIELAGRLFTVVGIVNPDFKGIDDHETSAFWAPLATSGMFAGQSSSPSEPRGIGLRLIGRLKQGIKPAQAQASLAILLPQITDSRPAQHRAVDAVLESSATYDRWDWNPNLTRNKILEFIPFFLVLLIACSNLANVQFARALNRHREIGVRLALGASRGRIVRQLATETAPIAIGGSILALLVADWTAAAIGKIALGFGLALPPFFSPRLDFPIAGFALLLAALAALLFGLLPALQATRPNLTLAIKGGEALLGPGPGLRRSRLRDALIVLQFALSLALLVAAGGAFRSAMNLAAVSPGCDTSHTLGGYLFGGVPAARLRDRLAEIPGVTSVARGSRVPLMGWDRFRPGPVSLGPAFDSTISAEYGFASPEYFDTLGIPILLGRPFTRSDSEFSAQVGIVSQSTARRFWQDQDPLGKQLRIATVIDRPSAPRTIQIVGVAGDTITREVRDGKEGSFVYLPIDAGNPRASTFVIRVEGNPAQMLPEIRSAISAAFPAAEFEMHTMEDYKRNPTLENKMSSAVAGTAGLLGLLLASIGIYGVIAYLVTQRTREIGIRIALGASRQDVISLVLRDGLRLMIVSAVGGLLIAVALSPVLAAAGFKFNIADPVINLVPTAVLFTVGLVASYLPARRAAAIEPGIALRYE